MTTPSEPASAKEVAKRARSLPYGQVRYGITTRGAYHLVDPSAALPAAQCWQTGGDDRTQLGWPVILPRRVTGTEFCRAFLQRLPWCSLFSEVVHVFLFLASGEHREASACTRHIAIIKSRHISPVHHISSSQACKPCPNQGILDAESAALNHLLSRLGKPKLNLAELGKHHHR